jgi:hypothetical protein
VSRPHARFLRALHDAAGHAAELEASTAGSTTRARLAQPTLHNVWSAVARSLLE